MNEKRIIKRYQNRKLYDTQQSSYVTLEEIAQIIKDGDEILVIDNKTKKDITYTTQIQLLFDQEKKSTAFGDVELLKRVIRGVEGTFSGYIKMLEAKLAQSAIADEMADSFAQQTTTSASELNNSLESSGLLN